MEMKHEFVPHPEGSNVSKQSCVRCGRVKDHPIHKLKEN